MPGSGKLKGWIFFTKFNKMTFEDLIFEFHSNNFAWHPNLFFSSLLFYNKLGIINSII